MPIIETAVKQADDIYRQLCDLVEVFPALDDTARMVQSEKLFDMMRNFFDRQDVILDYAFDRKPQFRLDFVAFDELHQEMTETYFRLILLHVDEPENEFLNRLRALRDQFGEYIGEGYHQFMHTVDEQVIAGGDETRLDDQIRGVKSPVAVSTIG